MRFVLICLVIISLGITVYAQDSFFWCPSKIRIAIERDDSFMKIGQYILFENELKSGELGWTMMKVDLPDTWKIEGLKFSGNYIVFSNQLKEQFKIAPPKLNELDFEILDGGDKPDKQLELLWRKYAKTN